MKCRIHGEISGTQVYVRRDGVRRDCRLCKKVREAGPKTKAYQRAWKAKNPEKIRAYKRAWAHRNLPSLAVAKREKTRRLRAEVIAAYGGVCACCHEDRAEFLEVDHVGGGGKQHVASLNRAFYPWLRKNRFPREGFRLLCSNCNHSIGRYGYCPHGGPPPQTPFLEAPIEPASDQLALAFDGNRLPDA